MSEENQKAEMYIRVIKLKSGEEIVTNVQGVGEDDNGTAVYLCLDPAFPAQDPENPNKLAFMPWVMFAANREFQISRDDMMCTPKEVDEQIEVEYKVYFAKGMELQVENKAPSKILMAGDTKIVTLN